MLAAPAIMVAPFLLGFGPAATAVAVLLGAVLLGLAVQIEGTGRALPVSAHAELDYALAIVSLAGGLTIGLATGEWYAAVFLVGVGIAQVALTACTRFTRPRGA